MWAVRGKGSGPWPVDGAAVPEEEQSSLVWGAGGWMFPTSVGEKGRLGGSGDRSGPQIQTSPSGSGFSLWCTYHVPSPAWAVNVG